MTTRDPCADIRSSLPELSLGSLTGQDRAKVLEHVLGCSACRRELHALSEAADELLMLVPAVEPAVGFESRVVARLGVGEHEASPRARARVLVALGLVAALVGSSAVYVATRADRDLADGYRRTLEVADGRYFSARALEDVDGAVAGHVFGYQGSPSWVFCVVESGAGDVLYEISLTSRDSRGWILGEMSAGEGSGTWGGPLPIDLHDVHRVELVARDGSARLIADWSSD